MPFVNKYKLMVVVWEKSFCQEQAQKKRVDFRLGGSGGGGGVGEGVEKVTLMLLHLFE